MSRLDRIATKHGADKASNAHGYVAQYERYFQPGAQGSLLELGWGGHEDPNLGGAGARTWREWLPRDWRVTSIDLEAKNPATVPNGVNLVRGSQADPDTIAFAAEGAGPFDIIIDDASHLSSLTIKSFELLWLHLKSGGWYVVEDTHMAYHDFYYGPQEANPDPDGELEMSERNETNQTAMQFLKRLADEANFKGRGEFDLFPERYWLGYEVEEVHFHFNIVFVKKR